mmetsp:Transcript_18679/g.44861  ORF Transcript_18679/g.44861 Transcript_18679/m.44861 type:complete len:124 (+) Transcript_18679:603-974(+)
MTRLNVSLDMGGSIVCNCSVAGREFWRWLPVAAATHPCNSFSRPTVTPRDDSHRHVGFTAATRFSSPRFTAATRFSSPRKMEGELEAKLDAVLQLLQAAASAQLAPPPTSAAPTLNMASLESA